MVALLFSLFLVAAPIPKSTYEGRIAFLLHQTRQSDLVIMTPTGHEILRRKLTGLEGKPHTVKLVPGGDYAVVSTVSPVWIHIGNGVFQNSTVYLVSLKDDSKPERLFGDKLRLNWVLTDYPTKILATEIDQQQMVKAKSGQKPTKAWTYDLETRKQKLLALPPDHSLVDISANGTTLLSTHGLNGKYQTATIPLKTGKPVFHSEITSIPLAISRNGGKLFLVENLRSINANGAINARRTKLVIHNLKTDEQNSFTLPKDCSSTSCHTFGADGKHFLIAAYIWSRTGNTVSQSYQIVLYPDDGHESESIYQAPQNETIGDIDWR
ncbi:MAG: hypothetical protein U0798_00730 [Gemmataceae bacterium]